ncbi:MAG: TRAP transporter substrate-binding protein [Burkholderiales bacterium]|nr:TRAP transporter substrate-binding protein [Burkholderiales bacterium]
MIKKSTRFALAGALMGMAMAFSGSSLAAPEFVFKLHHFLPAKAPAQTKMLEPWAAQVEKNSGGRVKIDIFPSMTLGGSPPQLIRQVRDGVVDLVWTVNGYTAGLFPRTEVFELPFIHTNNPGATSRAMYDMFKDDLASEYEGVEVMFLHVHAGQAMQMVDKLVRKPSDLAGLKMRIPTRTGAWVIEALGATPVGMPVPQLPQALSKKIVDGALIPWEIIPALKLQDQTEYDIEGPNKSRFGTTTFQVSMNKARWDKLPADIQKAFRDASGPDWWQKVGDIWAANDDGGIALAVKSGNKHIMLTDTEMEAFHTKLESVVDKWVAEVKGKGIDGAALVAKARKLIAKYSK